MIQIACISAYCNYRKMKVDNLFLFLFRKGSRYKFEPSVINQQYNLVLCPGLSFPLVARLLLSGRL